MAHINPNASIITLNTNGLNISTKRTEVDQVD